LPYAAFRFCYLVVCGIAVGLLLGGRRGLVRTPHRRRSDRDRHHLLVPYGAYLIATRSTPPGFSPSSRRASSSAAGARAFLLPAVRLQAYAVWDALTFMLNGLVFVLIGLQLPSWSPAIRDAGLGRMIIAGGACSALVIALRLIWVFPAARLSTSSGAASCGRTWRSYHASNSSSSAWSGMRGVIAPGRCHVGRAYHAGREALPYRDAIVFHHLLRDRRPRSSSRGSRCRRSSASSGSPASRDLTARSRRRADRAPIGAVAARAAASRRRRGPSSPVRRRRRTLSRRLASLAPG